MFCLLFTFYLKDISLLIKLQKQKTTVKHLATQNFNTVKNFQRVSYTSIGNYSVDDYLSLISSLLLHHRSSQLKGVLKCLLQRFILTV